MRQMFNKIRPYLAEWKKDGHTFTPTKLVDSLHKCFMKLRCPTHPWFGRCRICWGRGGSNSMMFSRWSRKLWNGLGLVSYRILRRWFWNSIHHLKKQNEFLSHAINKSLDSLLSKLIFIWVKKILTFGSRSWMLSASRSFQLEVKVSSSLISWSAHSCQSFLLEYSSIAIISQALLSTWLVSTEVFAEKSRKLGRESVCQEALFPLE